MVNSAIAHYLDGSATGGSSSALTRVYRYSGNLRPHGQSGWVAKCTPA